MAGTLTISTLSDGTNSTSSTNCIQGSAKAWVNFNGSGGASIRASYNISSVVRNGTGDYTINFASALSDASYCAVASQGRGAGSTISSTVNAPVGSNPTASAFRLYTISAAWNVADAEYVYVAVFR